MAFEVKEAEPLARHTVLRIGGPARFFVAADSREDFVAALRAARSCGLPFFVLGAGSNVLVADRGFPGVVIKPSGGTIGCDGNHLWADAGLSMARVAAEALRRGLRGFEWAVGIPGTIGGSVRGNAGCFGGEMKDVLAAITVFNASSGEIEEWPAKAADFGYRESIFKQRPELIVLAATLALRSGDAAEGQRLVREFSSRRGATQDIGSQTAGCMFKNIPWSRRDISADRLLERFPDLAPSGTVSGISAGFLIDRVGLKGYVVGGARISERHGNFFLNTGGATAEDVIILAGVVKEYVHRHYGLLLEEEIQYVGFE